MLEMNASDKRVTMTLKKSLVGSKLAPLVALEQAVKGEPRGAAAARTHACSHQPGVVCALGAWQAQGTGLVSVGYCSL